jgi:hypothetical protein
LVTFLLSNRFSTVDGPCKTLPIEKTVGGNLQITAVCRYIVILLCYMVILPVFHCGLNVLFSKKDKINILVSPSCFFNKKKILSIN